MNFRIVEIVSASLWGCELKCHDLHGIKPEDAVSLLVRLWVEMRQITEGSEQIASASLWGCELKYTYDRLGNKYVTSASLWGCELK